jgi:N-acetylmuramoyl-L-alanine amidase
MKNPIWLQWGMAASLVSTVAISSIAWADQPLFVAYPPDGHETASSQIFLIGTAPSQGQVLVNGQAIDRSPAGHFAPSVPLQIGENILTLRYQDQVLTLHVTRTSAAPPAPVGVAFASGSLTPAVDLARLPGEQVCFGAIAPLAATVSVTLGNQTMPLLPQANSVTLPPNSAVFTAHNQPIVAMAQNYQGCTVLHGTPEPQTPQFHLRLNGQTMTQAGTGTVETLSPTNPQVVEVTANSGTARTGPSTDYSRLTPLPKGTRAAVTGQEGEWLRLDYGGWIRTTETQVVENAVPPQTLIRSVLSRQVEGWTEVVFPLQVAVPVSVQQGDRTFTLTLYDTTAQTDVIRVGNDPVIDRLDWQQTMPRQVQYRFNLKSAQQWGYKLRYDGTSLILSLRHPPSRPGKLGVLPLTGIRILLDPGHGGPEDLGARGPSGYPEKEQTLITANLIRDRLQALGATVIMTRQSDIDLGPNERAALINQLEPTIALSLHYNALPDDGDAAHTAGVSTYWYNTQSQSFATFLHDDLVQRLDRPSFGIFWDNLALTRPTVAPAVLLEIGFMTNPEEFEWITNPQAQQHLADAITTGISQWLETR